MSTAKRRKAPQYGWVVQDTGTRQAEQKASVGQAKKTAKMVNLKDIWVE